MGQLSIAGIGAILLGLLCAFCIPRDARHIQQDLLTRSSSALGASGVPTAGLIFDGREALLTGYRGSPGVSPQAVATVQAVYGVRTVSTKLLDLAGSPEARQVETSLADLLKLKTIEFNTGSADLTASGRRTVDEVAAVLAGSPSLPIEISGHTDSRGRPEANLDLSRKRAAAVKQYLITKGIQGSRLTDLGLGETRPIANNGTEQGRQANRRIEFHVKEAK